jgi:hypothetical protein
MTLLHALVMPSKVMRFGLGPKSPGAIGPAVASLAQTPAKNAAAAAIARARMSKTTPQRLANIGQARDARTVPER